MLTYMRRGKGFYGSMFRLALPIILQNLIVTSLGMVDTFMVGVLGETSMAAVTAANIPVFVIDLLIFGIQSGCVVLISQYWGKGDHESINRVIGIGLYCCGILTTAFALAVFFWPVQTMSLFCNEPEVVALAAQYIRFVGFGYAFNGLGCIYVGACRSMENPKLGLIIYSIAVCINTFLNWVLIFGNLGAPALGVAGAAIATSISFGVQLLIVIVYACVNRRFKINVKCLLLPGKAMIRRFAKYSTPVVFNETMWGLGTSIYPTIMGHMAGSTEILAAYTIAGNIEKLCTVAVFGVAATASIIIGKEIGKGNQKEVYSIACAIETVSFLTGLCSGLIMLGLLHVVIVPFVYPLFGLSARSASISTMMVTVMTLFLAARSYNSTNIVGVLRGGGDVKAATLIDILPLWCVAIPIAAIAGLVLKVDIFWVYIALSVENVVKFFFGLYRFKSKKWINDITKISS